MSKAWIPTGSSGIDLVWRRVAPWAIAISVIAAGLSVVGVRALESWRRGRDVKAAEAALKAAKAALDARSPEGRARCSRGRRRYWVGPGTARPSSCWARANSSSATQRRPRRPGLGCRRDRRFEPHASLYRARGVLSHDRFADAEPLLLTALGGQGAHATEARETLVNLYKIQGRFDEARALCWARGARTATPPAC